MKTKHIFFFLMGLLAVIGITSCDSEKDLIVIEGNLPIKTSTLFMVGDATPAGWDIGNPATLTSSTEDPLVFSWEGSLYSGEMKLCLTSGSWDAPFIRPANDQRAIGKENITNETFIMHAGDPDEKWRVTEAGKYVLTFDLRNWTMSTVYVGPLDGPTIEPIIADNFYIVGDATPNGWNIDDPTKLEKQSDFVFIYEGNLHQGEMKACIQSGDWGVPFVRPLSHGVKINKSGIESEDFVYSNNPDDKWVVEDEGKYRLTFDLQNWKVKSEYIGEADPEVVIPSFYIVGDATPNGWDINNPTELTMTADGVFEYVGQLGEGEFKGCREKGSWDNPFVHPEVGGTRINSAGIEKDVIEEYPGGDDKKWFVEEAGNYRLTFDLNNMTFSAKKEE